MSIMILKKTSLTYLFLSIVYIIVFLCTPSRCSGIYYIESSVSEIMISLFALLVFYIMIIVLYYKDLRINTIGLLLFARFMLLSVSLILNISSDNLACYLSSFFSLIVYIVAVNMPFEEKQLLVFTYAINVLVFIQVLFVVICQISSGIGLNELKVNIQTPFGGSNYVSTVIIMIVPFLWYAGKNKILKVLMIILALLSLILTRTTSGILVFFLFLLYVLIKDGKGKELKIILSIIGMFFCVYVIYKIYPEYMERLTERLMLLMSGESTEWYRAFNGRIPLYQSAFDYAITKPVFGVGFSYRNYMMEGMMAHNWILEVFLTGGLVGVIVYISIVLTVFVKLKRYEKKGMLFAKIMIVSCACVLLQGIFEPSIGTFRFDFVLWLIIGMVFSLSQKNMEKV